MLAPIPLVFVLILGVVTRNCPLLQEREYRVPPVNGPVDISKDPLPKKKKEKP